MKPGDEAEFEMHAFPVINQNLLNCPDCTMSNIISDDIKQRLEQRAFKNAQFEDKKNQQRLKRDN